MWGGGGLDALANDPDVTSGFYLNSGTNKNIAVTKLPRYIMIYRHLSPTTSTRNYDNGIAVIQDVAKGIGYYIGYSNDGTAYSHNLSTIIGTVTSTNVQILNPNTSNRYRYDVAIWY